MKKILKIKNKPLQIIAGLFFSAGFLLFSGSLESIEQAAAEEISVPAVTVILDGQPLFFPDTAPYIDEQAGRVLVPMRLIFEKLGAAVDWNEDTQTITAVKDDITLDITIGSWTGIINGTNTELSLPPIIKDGRTMVPLRFVSETLGATVEWDSVAYTVSISSPAASSLPTSSDSTLDPAAYTETVKKNLHKSSVSVKANITSAYYSVGSGVLLGNNGHVATAYHVLESEFTTIDVYTSDGKKYSATKVVGFDKDYDLAVLSIDLDQDFKAPEVKFNLAVENGDPIFLVGNPSNEKNQLTEGTVISNHSESYSRLYIKCNPLLAAGCSGGGLYDANGNLAGIISFTNELEKNISAIPASVLERVLKQQINISLTAFNDQNKKQIATIRDEAIALQKEFAGKYWDKDETFMLNYIIGNEATSADQTTTWKIFLVMNETNYLKYNQAFNPDLKTQTEEIMQRIYTRLSTQHPDIKIELDLLMFEMYSREPHQYKNAGHTHIKYDENLKTWKINLEICSVYLDKNQRLKFEWYD